MKFFLLVLALSLPFWALGIFAPNSLLPFGMPISALMFICPLLAALILTSLQGGRPATQKLFGRVFDVRQIKQKRWIAIAALTMPTIMVLAWLLMTYLNYPLPAASIVWVSVPFMVVVYFIGAIGEELGWMGYLIDPFQKKIGALPATLFLGLFWGAWHVVPFYVMGRSVGWIAAQAGTMVLGRVLIVWLYHKANRSVFVAIVFHTFINVSFSLFPNQGSNYDPAITAVVLALFVGMLGAATLLKTRRDLVNQPA